MGSWILWAWLVRLGLGSWSHHQPNTLALFGLNVMQCYEQSKSSKHGDNCLSYCIANNHIYIYIGKKIRDKSMNTKRKAYQN